MLEPSCFLRSALGLLLQGTLSNDQPACWPSLMEILYALGDMWVWDSEKNPKSTRTASALRALAVPSNERSWPATSIVILERFSLLSGHAPDFLSTTQVPLRVYKISSFSFWVFRELCCWSPIMRSWIMILQPTLDLLMLIFYFCSPGLSPLPPSLWYLLMDIHLSAQDRQAWHQLFIHLPKPSLSALSLVPGLPHLVLCYEHNDPRK